MSPEQPVFGRGDVVVRNHLAADDLPVIRSLAASTRMFSAVEVGIAVDLVSEYLEKGAESGYWFSVAETEGLVVGYACYGPIPCTAYSWDLYWIAVHPTKQRGGIGAMLLRDVEEHVRKAGGTRVYVDTSGRPAYAPTRSFYERMGYARAAVLPDFYAPDDAKVIYAKVLEAATTQR